MVKLVSFDLDDTLIREIHSVMLPCILNGKEQEHSVIQAREESGELDYITADYLRAELLSGLVESKIADKFLEIAKPLKHIKSTVEHLHSKNILCIVITVGPIQVAKVVKELYGFDACFGSDYEVKAGVFTGIIKDYIEAAGKVRCLIDFCGSNSITPDECIAVGDGSTDIPLFEFCGKSIALNASANVQRKATCSITTDDLSDILCFIQ